MLVLRPRLAALKFISRSESLKRVSRIFTLCPGSKTFRNNYFLNNIVQRGLAKICWHLIASPSTPDFLGMISLNLALGLVTSRCNHQTKCWRLACCWLG